MTPETWTIIGTGVAVIVVNLGLFAWLRGDMASLRSDIGKLTDRVAKLENELGERIARLEGKMDLLLQGLQIRIEPKNTSGAD